MATSPSSPEPLSYLDGTIELLRLALRISPDPEVRAAIEKVGAAILKNETGAGADPICTMETSLKRVRRTVLDLLLLEVGE